MIYDHEMMHAYVYKKINDKVMYDKCTKIVAHFCLVIVW